MADDCVELPIFELPIVILPGELLPLHIFEERYVQHVLAQNGGNVTRAAHAAGIGRRYFQRIRERRKE